MAMLLTSRKAGEEEMNTPTHVERCSLLLAVLENGKQCIQCTLVARALLSNASCFRTAQMVIKNIFSLFFWQRISADYHKRSYPIRLPHRGDCAQCPKCSSSFLCLSFTLSAYMYTSWRMSNDRTMRSLDPGSPPVDRHSRITNTCSVRRWT